MTHLTLILIALVLSACSSENASGGQQSDANSSSTPTSSGDLISSEDLLSSEMGSSSSSLAALYSGSSTKSGTFTDPRDGHVYPWKTFTVNYKSPVTDPVYMAENLAYVPSSGKSWCYQDLPANCTKYGRLYDWSTAMNGAASSQLHPSGVQGICPDGWHLPSVEEWATLTEIAMYKKTYMNLTGWDPTGTNTPSNYSGFSALPGGERLAAASGGLWYTGEGFKAYFWSSTKQGTNTAIRWTIDNTSEELELSKFHRDSTHVNAGLSVRCIKNQP